MTTIAYKDGVIAADGRVRCGDDILTDSRCKMIELEDGKAFVSGNDSHLDALESAGSIESGAKIPGDEWNALFVDHVGRAFLCGSDDGVIWKCRFRDDVPRAIGSGADYAMGAMAMGSTARQAVEIAARLDSATGGEIREWNIGDL